MAEERQLKWQSYKDLLLFSGKLDASVSSSMDSKDDDTPKECLMATPSYITDEVFELATSLLKNETNRDPIVVVDIDANGVELSFVTISGHRMYHINIVEQRKVKDIKSHDHTRESFLEHIAQECYKLANSNSNCFTDINGRILHCAMIFQFRIEQTAINESTVSKFSKNFFLPDVEGRDLLLHFNKQLDMQKDDSKFKLECTHLMNHTPQAFAGFCMHNYNYHEDRIPDVFVSAGHGAGIFYFDKEHKIKKFNVERMIMDLHYTKFGAIKGSLESNFLRRFLTPIDHKINGENLNNKNHLSYLISGSEMCDNVQKFLQNGFPDFSTKYPWLDKPKSITEKDVSDLLESVSKEKQVDSLLSGVYYGMNQESQKKFFKFCKDLRDRSAAIFAALTFGIMKRVARQNSSKRRLVIGLDGDVLLDMYGYKEKFEENLNMLQRLNVQENSADLAVWADYVETEKKVAIYGMVALSKYVWRVVR